MDQDKVSYHNQQGNEYFSQGNFSFAEKEYRVALNYEPNDPILHSNIAGALIELSRIEEAEIHLKKSINLDSENARVHFMLGNIYYSKGSYWAAEKEYRNSLKLETNLTYFKSLLFALNAQSKFDVAINECKIILENNSDSHEIYNMLGECFCNKEDYVNAEQEFKKAIYLESSIDTYHINLANLLIQQNRYEEAESEYQFLINFDPQNPYYYYYIGTLYSLTKRYNDAEEKYKKAISLDISIPLFHYELACLYNYANKITEAEQELIKASNSEIDGINYCMKLSDFYMSTQKYDLAELQYKKALKKFPDDPYLNYYVAESLKMQNNFDDAEYYYLYAIKLNENIALFHSSLGELYKINGKYKLAEAKYEYAIKLEPNEPYYYYYLAELNKVQYAYNNSEYNYLRAIELNNSIPDFFISLGELYHILGKYKLAEAKLKKALEIAPDNLSARYLLSDSYYNQKLYIEAEQELMSLLNKCQDDVSIYNALGRVNREIGNYDKALQYFGKSHKLDPNNSWTYCGIAKIFIRLKKFDDALPLLKKSIALCNENPDSHYNLGLIYYNYGEQNNANKEFAICKKIWNDLKYPQNEFDISFPYYEKINNFHKIAIIVKENVNSITEDLYALFSRNNEFNNFLLKIKEIIIKYQKPLNLVVMGEYNVGKSSFINCLIKEEILITGNRPVTATVNKIKYGDKPQIILRYKNNNDYEEIPFNNYKFFVDEKFIIKDTADTIDYLELLYPNPILKMINIIDTPGFNSGNSRHETIAHNSCKDADAILWLFSVGQTGKGSEKKVIDYVKKFSNKTVAIINRVDTVKNKEEIDDLIDYINDNFEGYFSNIIPFSSKNFLNGIINKDHEQLQKSNHVVLKQYLIENILNNTKKNKKSVLATEITNLFYEFEDFIYKFEVNKTIIEKYNNFKNKFGID